MKIPASTSRNVAVGLEWLDCQRMKVLLWLRNLIVIREAFKWPSTGGHRSRIQQVTSTGKDKSMLSDNYCVVMPTSIYVKVSCQATPWYYVYDMRLHVYQWWFELPINKKLMYIIWCSCYFAIFIISIHLLSGATPLVHPKRLSRHPEKWKKRKDQGEYTGRT